MLILLPRGIMDLISTPTTDERGRETPTDDISTGRHSCSVEDQADGRQSNSLGRFINHKATRRCGRCRADATMRHSIDDDDVVAFP